VRVLMISKACIRAAYQRKLEALAAQGVELTVVVPPYWRDDTGRKEPLERGGGAGYRLIVEPMALNGHYHSHFYPGLARRVREVRPDVVHMDEEPYNLSTFQAFWHARRIGARPLFFAWQNLLRRYPPPFSWMERYCYRHAAGAIAGNAEADAVLRGKGFVRQTWVIPQFGIDPAIFYRRQPPAASRPFTVGWCSGRLRPEKGVHLLVEAVAALRDDTRLEVLGWGPEEPRLRELAGRLGLGERFRIHPALPSEQVPEFLARVDVVALPSVTFGNWKEQFGRVLMEAMACEVPVVGSDSGEIPHVIGDAGLVHPEGDVPALTSHLRRLRDDATLRRALAARGLARAHAKYTQDRIAAQTAAAYRAVYAGA
jgi:glycosyltransferase involved in cell wall biosynthesis